jgi:hypothetical protein
MLILAVLCVDNKEGIKGKFFLQKEVFLVVNSIKEYTCMKESSQ